MEITRELNKKSLLHSYTIYTKASWSMLVINNPTLMSMHCSCFYYTVYICPNIILLASFPKLLAFSLRV